MTGNINGPVVFLMLFSFWNSL